jgi:outer membrane protein assembly factor BamB
MVCSVTTSMGSFSGAAPTSGGRFTSGAQVFPRSFTVIFASSTSARAKTTYLLAVEKKTGRTVWKHDEATGYSSAAKGQEQGTYIGSWSTPVVMKVEGRDQLLMSWPRRLAAYDPADGKELWSCTGLNPLVYTSPIYGEGIVVALGGFNGSAFAVRAGGSGDITASQRLWQHPRSPQRIGSGVVRDGHIYIHNDPGTAMCLDLKTGEMVWQERLRGKAASGENWSSVLLADDKCYTINQAATASCSKRILNSSCLPSIHSASGATRRSSPPMASCLFAHIRVFGASQRKGERANAFRIQPTSSVCSYSRTPVVPPPSSRLLFRSDVSHPEPAKDAVNIEKIR